MALIQGPFLKEEGKNHKIGCETKREGAGGGGGGKNFCMGSSASRETRRFGFSLKKKRRLKCRLESAKKNIKRFFLVVRHWCRTDSMDLPGALRVLEVIVQDPGGANRGHCNVDVEIAWNLIG